MSRTKNKLTWSSPEDFNMRFSDPRKEANMILSKNLRKAYDENITSLNNNVLCIGSSGCGKTEQFIIPNVLESHGSNVYIDVTGRLYERCGHHLKEKGKKVLSLNIIDPQKSDKYNPLANIKNKKDIRELLWIIDKYTLSPGREMEGLFWWSIEKSVLECIFFYVWKECDDTPYYKYAFADHQKCAENILTGCVDIERIGENIWRGKVIDNEGKEVRLQKNFRSVLKLIDEMADSEDSPSQFIFDARMEALKLKAISEDGNPVEHPALESYSRFARSEKGMLYQAFLHLKQRLAFLYNEELLDILDGNDIDIHSFLYGVNGDGKTGTAMFCIMPEYESPFTCITDMFLSQIRCAAYETLCGLDYLKTLQIGLWFDNFANVTLARFLNYMCKFPSASISMYVVVCLQSFSQASKVFGMCVFNKIKELFHTVVIMEDLSHNQRTLWGAADYLKDSFSPQYEELITDAAVRDMSSSDTLIFTRWYNPVCDVKYGYSEVTKEEHQDNQEEKINKSEIRTRKFLSVKEKEEIILAYWNAPDIKIKDFCKEKGVALSTFYSWQRAYESQGVKGLERKRKTMNG